jgi:hypothetical protein
MEHIGAHLTAAIWHNHQTSQPVLRSLTAYDHRPLGSSHLGHAVGRRSEGGPGEVLHRPGRREVILTTVEHRLEARPEHRSQPGRVVSVQGKAGTALGPVERERGEHHPSARLMTDRSAARYRARLPVSARKWKTAR